MPNAYFAAPELASLLDGSSAGELIPELARYGLQQLIELEASAVVGADCHERTEERLAYRNGYRPRTLTTQVGDLELQIPKLRSGGFLPTILEPRRRVDQALYAVIMEAYIAGGLHPQGRCPGGCPWLPERHLQVAGQSQGHPRDSRGLSPGNLWGPRICQEIDQ